MATETVKTQFDSILSKLNSMNNPEATAEQFRVGINTQSSLGINMWDLRNLAKEEKMRQAQ